MAYQADTTYLNGQNAPFRREWEHGGVCTEGGNGSRVTVNVYNYMTCVDNRVFCTRPAYSRKSRWIAFILCLFLGQIGVHRFYAGKVGTGLIWLFTGGFFGIGWILDLLRILLGHFRDGDGYLLA